MCTIRQKSPNPCWGPPTQSQTGLQPLSWCCLTLSLKLSLSHPDSATSSTAARSRLAGMGVRMVARAPFTGRGGGGGRDRLPSPPWFQSDQNHLVRAHTIRPPLPL